MNSKPPAAAGAAAAPARSDPWADFFAGSPAVREEARHRLFLHHQDLAEALAGKYIRITPAHKADPEDLQMAAYEGLLHALDHFDPARREREGPWDEGFRAYASRCVFGYLMMEMIAQDLLSQRLLQEVRQFRRQADALAQELGRAPTDDELRTALGGPDEKRFQLLEALADYPVNVESLAPEEGRAGDGDEAEIEGWNITRAVAAGAGRCPRSANLPYQATVLTLFREQLQAAVEELPPLQQQLVRVHYYGEETLSQMARDIGISRQTLYKHRRQALGALHETLTARGYGPESVPEEWVLDRAI